MSAVHSSRNFTPIGPPSRGNNITMYKISNHETIQFYYNSPRNKVIYQDFGNKPARIAIGNKIIWDGYGNFTVE